MGAIKISNTLEVSGNLKKTVNAVTKLTVAINPSQDFTEYTEQQILVAASGSSSINLGGMSYPKFMYIETDNAVTFKSYRGASVIASAIPIQSSLLITANDSNRYGTVTITNDGASEADVTVYMCE